MYDNKRVVILGPSACVLENTAEDIESYDVVVRLNNGWPVKPERQPFVGTRMDVLFHNSAANSSYENSSYSVKSFIENPDFNQTKFVYIHPTKQGILLRKHCKKVGVKHSGSNFYLTHKRLRQEGFSENHVFNCGYIAINHILEFPIKELYITGLSFYRQRYYKGFGKSGLGSDSKVYYVSCMKNTKGRYHNPELELRHFLNFVLPKYKDRIRMDHTMKLIVAMEKMI